MTDNIPHDIYKAHPVGYGDSGAVLILTADKTEDIEFFYPYYRFLEAGYRVEVVTPGGGEFKGKHGSGLKDTKDIRDIDPGDYDLLYIPGGKAPEKLKKEVDALQLVMQFFESGKPIAALCHGPQLLAASGVAQMRRIAAWPEVEGELTDAGIIYVNEAAVVDGPFITARWPGDLPAHLAKTLEVLQSAGHSASRMPGASPVKSGDIFRGGEI